MRIRHKELEAVRADYRRWAARSIAPGSGGPRRSYASVTRDAIYKYHKTGDAAIARGWLVDALAPFANRARRDGALFQFDRYVEVSAQSHDVVVDFRINVNYDLGSGITLGGQVSRLDLVLASGHYRVVLLGPRPDDWPGDLRFPLLQRAVSEMYSRDQRLTEVAIQEIDGSGLVAKTFSRSVIESAVAAARSLARDVSRELARLVAER